MRIVWIAAMGAAISLQAATPASAQGNSRVRQGEGAAHCLYIEQGGKAFRNKCPFDVFYQFCRLQPRENNRINNCADPKSTNVGYQRIPAGGRDTQYLNGEIRWAACKSPAIPKGVTFDGSNLQGRCEIT